jgi:hypothetical protein
MGPIHFFSTEGKNLSRVAGFHYNPRHKHPRKAGLMSGIVVDQGGIMRRETMTSHADVLPVYRRLRQVGVKLNHKLVKTLSAEAFRQGASALDILKGEKFVFDSEDESAVLMDFCIHNVRIDGLNAVQRYLDDSPPEADSDEMLLLTAMLGSFYSLVQVVEAEHGVGVTVVDALCGDTFFVADIGLGTSGQAGSLFATRLFGLEDEGFHMTGGAGLPVTTPALEKIRKALDRRFAPGTDFALLTPEQESDLAALVIRSCLASGMSSQIVYGRSAEISTRKDRSIDPREIRQANRNDPCPCRSGRKFKTCCGRRPRL